MLLSKAAWDTQDRHKVKPGVITTWTATCYRVTLRAAIFGSQWYLG